MPGEDLTKVTYRLIDPEQYRGRRVLIVGGGDSALEAAHAISQQPGTRVALSYRAEAFSRARANRERIDAAEAAGQVQLLMSSELTAIEMDCVRLQQGERSVVLPNDAVIINAGGLLPTEFLQAAGVRFETKFGTA